jgi:hypothetical protein
LVSPSFEVKYFATQERVQFAAGHGWRAEQSAFFFQKELAALLILWKREGGLFTVLINALGCYAGSSMAVKQVSLQSPL